MNYVPAIYREVSIFSFTYKPWLHDSPFRLIVPIAVRRIADGSIEIVEPTWSQCWSPRRHVDDRQCVVYFPAGVDAIVYLREWIDGWRKTDVQCLCGDVVFCRTLERCAHNLWSGPVNRRWLAPREVAAMLSSVCH